MSIIKGFLSLLFVLSVQYTYAQNDAAKITEAQYALETQRDCQAAAKALNEVSQDGRTQQLFAYYEGKTADCLNDFDIAIFWYNKYLEFVPGDAVIIERLAKLSYNKRKDGEHQQANQKEKESNYQMSPESWIGTWVRVNTSGQTFWNKVDTIFIISGSDRGFDYKFTAKFNIGNKFLVGYKDVNDGKYKKYLKNLFKSQLHKYDHVDFYIDSKLDEGKFRGGFNNLYEATTNMWYFTKAGGRPLEYNTIYVSTEINSKDGEVKFIKVSDRTGK